MTLIARRKYDIDKMRECASKIAQLQGDERDFLEVFLEFCVYSANGQASFFEDQPDRLFPSSQTRFYYACHFSSLPVERYDHLYGRTPVTPAFLEYQEAYTSFARGLLLNPCCPMSILLDNSLLRSDLWPFIAQNEILPLWLATEPDALAKYLLNWYKSDLILSRSIGRSRWSRLNFLEAIATKEDEYPWAASNYSDEWLLDWFDENLRLVGIDKRIPRPKRTSRGVSSSSIAQWLRIVGEYAQVGNQDLFRNTLRTLDRRSWGTGARSKELSWKSYGSWLLETLVNQAGIRGIFVFLDQCRVMAKHLQTPFPYHILSEIMEDYAIGKPDLATIVVS